MKYSSLLVIYLVTALMVCGRAAIAEEAPELAVPWKPVPLPPASLCGGDSALLGFRFESAGPHSIVYSDTSGMLFLFEESWRKLPKVVASRDELYQVAVNDETVAVKKTDGSLWRLESGSRWVEVGGFFKTDRCQLRGAGRTFLVLLSQELWLIDGRDARRIYKRPDNVQHLGFCVDEQPAVWIVENRVRLKRYAGEDKWIDVFSETRKDYAIADIIGERGRTFVKTKFVYSGAAEWNTVDRSGTSRIGREKIDRVIPIHQMIVCEFEDRHLEFEQQGVWKKFKSPPNKGHIFGAGRRLVALGSLTDGVFEVSYEEIGSAIAGRGLSSAPEARSGD